MSVSGRGERYDVVPLFRSRSWLHTKRRSGRCPSPSLSGQWHQRFFRQQCPPPSMIESSFDPAWNGNGTDVAALANQVHDRPMALPHQQVSQPQADQLRTAKATAEQHSQHGIVPLGSQGYLHWRGPALPSFVEESTNYRSENPVFSPLHSADSVCQLR